MAAAQPNPTVTDDLTYCAVHPDRETALQCNKCGRYMCVQCAVQSPVGYRCRECVRGIQDKFYNVQPADYAIVFGVCLLLMAVGSYIAMRVGFLLFILLLSAPVGGAIAEAALRVTQRRRGRQSANVAAAGALLGGLVPLIVLFALTGRIVPVIGVILYVVIATAAVYGRFRMRS